MPLSRTTRSPGGRGRICGPLDRTRLGHGQVRHLQGVVAWERRPLADPEVVASTSPTARQPFLERGPRRDHRGRGRCRRSRIFATLRRQPVNGSGDSSSLADGLRDRLDQPACRSGTGPGERHGDRQATRHRVYHSQPQRCSVLSGTCRPASESSTVPWPVSRRRTFRACGSYSGRGPVPARVRRDDGDHLADVPFSQPPCRSRPRPRISISPPAAAAPRRPRRPPDPARVSCSATSCWSCPVKPASPKAEPERQVTYATRPQTSTSSPTRRDGGVPGKGRPAASPRGTAV